MPRKRNPLADGHRTSLGEDMFVTEDERSLQKGRRVAPRTQVCRPCLVWTRDAPEEKRQAVALDLNAYGMLVRTVDPLPLGARVHVQLMRDEFFQTPLSGPLELEVVRVEEAMGGFADLGLKHLLKKLAKDTPAKSAQLARPARPRPPKATRMHLADEIETRRTRR